MTRPWGRAGVALLALCAFAAPGLAAQGARVRAEVDSTRITVGDRITLDVAVEHPPGARVAWPDSLDVAPFEVLEADTLGTERQDDVEVSRARWVLTAFSLGDLEIPSFDVPVTLPDGSADTLATDAFGVQVVSVGTDPSGDIRDIRGPLALPRSVLRLALLVLLPLLVIALLYLLARRLRARRGGEEAVAAPPPAPAHEVALAALVELEASDLLERGRVKEYHIAVSNILRTYVEDRFRVDAHELTTSEVLERLARVGIEGSFASGLRAFLEQCDLVKFAKVRPAAAQSRQVLELGRRL
ncbi:MAG TPA: hypothetical protein VFQ22_03590, partial [Longimicrobiales bacterium]|nr:hypothetical protein [Longimicrobiales bacterium]